MHTPLSITVEGLSFTYNANSGRYVFRNLNFTLRGGEILLLTGPSGSGKTTLLKLLAGLSLPDSKADGSIRYSTGGEQYVLPAEEKSFIRRVRTRYMGLIFQSSQSAFLDDMPLFDQLQTGFRNRLGLRSEEAYLAFSDYLGGFGFSRQEKILKRRPDQLSGGQLQRIDIAYALFTQCKFLLLDEPLTALDQYNYNLVIHHLKTFREHGGVMVVASHDDRLADLLQGKVMRLNVEQTGEGNSEKFNLELDSLQLVSKRKLQLEAKLSKSYLHKSSGPESSRISLFENLRIQLDSRTSFLAVTGESGVGKSTLLKILAGIEEADSGTKIEFSTLPAAVEMIFQASPQSLNPAFRLKKILKNTKKGSAGNIAALMYSFRLPPELLNRKPGELSGGQIQRFCFIKALLNVPDLLLLDEPFTGLDTYNKAVIIECLGKIKNTTDVKVILVTHSPGEVSHLYDRLLTLS